jgi:hypothetical protein
MQANRHGLLKQKKHEKTRSNCIRKLFVADRNWYTFRSALQNFWMTGSSN